MKKDLVERCDLKEEEAAEVVNILPQSLEELRAFTFGWKKAYSYRKSRKNFEYN